MIPKILTIKGLYSYQSEQTIDFEKLTQSNLFGIFGNVGAGKSSILEAIMYALYGEVERLGSKGRSYNIMNLRSDDLLILFDFEIGGKLYRSKVLGRRNTKKFNDVKVDAPTFFEFFEDQFKPIDIKTAESLIHLKPEDFKKTIIIPQGTFQDFLQLGDTDRTRMMRELFGLERYELEPKVKVLQNENDTKIQILRGQQTQIGTVNFEEIENTKTQLIELQKHIESLQIELAQKRRIENELNQLKIDFELWQKAQKLNTELAAKENDFLLLEKQIADFELAVLRFKSPLENHKKLEKDLISNEANLQSRQKEFDNNDLKLQDLTKQKESLTPQYEQRESLKKQALEVQKIIDIKTEEIELAGLNARLVKGYELLKDKMETLEAAKFAIKEVEHKRTQLRENQPNLNQINAVKDWFTISFNFNKEITRLENERKMLDEKLAAMYQSKSVLVWKDLPPLGILLTNETRISEVIAQVKLKITALTTENEKIQHELLHLKASEKLEDWASALVEGDACPLCGAVHHPSVMQIGEVRSTLKNLELRFNQNKKQLKTLENIENQLITLNTNFNNETEARQRINQMIVEEKQKSDAHFQKFAWSSFSNKDYSAVEKAIQAATEFDSKMKQFEDNLWSINKNKDITETDIEKYRKGISHCEAQKAAKESAVQVLKAQIEVLNFEDTIIKPKSELKNWAENLEKQYIAIETAFQKLEENIQICQSEKQLLRGILDTLRQAKIDLESHHKNVLLELHENLAASPFDDLETVASIIGKNLDTPSERQKLNDYKNLKLLAATRLSDLNEKLQGKTYDSEEHTALILEIQQLGQNEQVQNQRVGEFKRDILDKTLRLQQLQDIEKQLIECDLRSENLKILRGLFQRSGFVNYASSVFLQSIIRAANERFTQLTKQQLRLEITENNNFIVRDMLNDGHLRDVRTLSGGQTFQAALCLALALSDHIQSRNQARQNFFFLDEGFGSLDRESLQTVFETLKALRKENRIVGIISHVEDMRLEIDRYLYVQLTEGKGSEVEMVVG